MAEGDERRTPRLVATQQPSRPTGLVLVLHGGAARPSRPAVSPTQLSVLRMVPIARRIARADRGLAVVRLLNSTRGWDATTTPVDDVRWALAQLRARYGEIPVSLVGHSLGGRAALLAGEADAVRTVVALNPWVYPTDDADLAGRRVLVVHGTDDHVALPERARAVVASLRRRTEVEYVEVPGGKHAMLRHGRTFERAATAFVTGTPG
ncbi:alpha/beta hydrolase [Nocardioides mangrovi]|uniref:Alpha/beta hydrolase n=1 Tax=Nocardioides mangrovi TaxID=2874580 RepID=A0ABS7U9H4_9ACTN|nr:alpha/beta fold hydrolase [Nocardioides mangrovi]MBZ5737633.1 alpha/beta hydrolase [Nocardioides mangrovi]